MGHVTSAAIDDLRTSLLGEVVAPDDPGYDEARSVWNGIIDRRPGAIARCSGLADVVEAVRVVREHRLDVAVRGGGHQVAGGGVCDDGLVVDLSSMNGVHVDPTARTARVQAGARWHDVDRATQLFGLATTGGEVSVTGVAGLTLGGGMGLLHRAFGLACDNLRSIEVVTADGVVRTASATEHPDLYWAAKGGGRGLGVVTSFEFGLRPLGPEVAVSWFLHDLDDRAGAAEVARAWRELALAAPDTVTPQLLLWNVPPDPDVPEELHGRAVLMTLAAFAGDPADAGPALDPFAGLGYPLADLGGVVPYAALQSSVDALFPDGDRYCFKSHFVDDLSDDCLDVMLDEYVRCPNRRSLIALRTMGGAVDRVGPDESAYAHRGRRINLSIDGAWSDPADDAALLGWVRGMWSALAPFATGGVYVNFAGLDDEADVTAAGALGNEARLAEVRATYDPAGMFAGAAGRR